MSEESGNERPGFFGPGLLTASYLGLSLLIALLPGRIGLSLHQAQFSGNPWTLILVGLAVDSPFVVVTYALALGAGVLLARVIRRRWPSLRTFGVIVVAATSAGFLFVLFGTIAASEFKVERGLYPTLFDLRVGMSDSGYARSAFGTFFLARFFWGWLLGLVTFLGVSIRYWTRMRRLSTSRAGRELGLAAGALLAIALAGFGLHRASPHLFASIANWRVVESPFPTFVKSLGSSRENVRFGFMALVDQMASPEPERARGAALMGFSPSAGRNLGSGKERGCETHPLAEPLAGPREGGTGVNAEFAAAVTGVLGDISRELFTGRSRLRIWHVSLESMRGDDLSALNPKAPAGLAPVLDGLYAAASAGAPRVIATKQMYQAGVRTSQGLSAMLCGTGTMPWGLSFARDVGLVPFRCLPDVLKDAGFSLHFYYGSNPAFDNMQAFLLYHGFDHLMTERDYTESIPHRGWAVPDRVVLSQALAASRARPSTESQYNLVMTLSNHHPYDRPEDQPAEIEGRVRDAIAKSGRSVGDDDRKRLEAFSYADLALGEMLSVLEASNAAADSVVLILGDHSTGDYVLWSEAGVTGAAERRLALARVPFLIVLPDALVRASQNPERVKQLVAELNALLATRPVSQNDIPRLLLALLSHQPGLESLPERLRWHNLGGQALSPSFRAEGLPDARVLGIDAASRVFWAGADAKLVDPDEPASQVFDVETAGRVTPTLAPEAALLGGFMRSYGRRCWEWRSIRSVR